MNRYSQLRLTGLRNLNRQLPKMLLIPHILIRIFGLLKPKHLLIHHRLDPLRINRLCSNCCLDPTNTPRTVHMQFKQSKKVG